MQVTILRVINSILDSRFKSLLVEGAFPEVNYKEGNGFRSYNMFEFSEIWARFVKVVDDEVKARKLDERMGIFTRKHSAPLLAEIQAIADSVTEEDVRNHGTRLKTMWDEMTGKDPNKPMWDNGEFVACDFCNEGEETMGGVVIGTYSICGDCANKINHPEEIDKRFDVNKTFRQNVIEYRKEIYGHANAGIEVLSF